MKSRNSLTLVQLNDSHAYFDLHQEVFWQGSRAVYRPAGGYARMATLVNQVRAANQGSVLFCDCGDTLHGTHANIKIENPPGQRVRQVFVGGKQLEPGRHYPTAFVTEQGVEKKYGRNRQHHTERSLEVLRTYLTRHRPLHAEIRGTFVAV